MAGSALGQDPACPSHISMSPLEHAPSRPSPSPPPQLQGTGQSLLGSSAPPTPSTHPPEPPSRPQPGSAQLTCLPQDTSSPSTGQSAGPRQPPATASHDWPCLFQGPQNMDFVSMDQMSQTRSYLGAFVQANPLPEHWTHGCFPPEVTSPWQHHDTDFFPHYVLAADQHTLIQAKANISHKA